MSVNLHPLRDEPAGSEFAVPGAQYVGREVRTRLALLPRRGGWTQADAVRWSEEFRHDPLVVPGAGERGGPVPAPEAGLAVDGSGVVTSSVRPRDTGVEVRLVAMTDEPTTATVTGSFGSAVRTDLLGRALESLDAEDGRFDVELGAWEIATIRLT